MTKSRKRLPLEWRWTAGPIDDCTISNVENRWGIKFPDDYVTCAREVHGGHPSLKCFDIPERGEAVLSRLLAFVEGANPSITRVYEAVKDRLPPKLFPFAEDPFGNLLCFDYRKDKNHPPTITFWDHEVAYSDRDDSVTYVCDTFTDLLEKLYNLE